ncbi:MAG: gliding motility-associated protein GldE [Bacteroidales bacterium]|nr:gliding motility-associated protein GldE [Bacteroidales bacterium]
MDADYFSWLQFGNVIVRGFDFTSLLFVIIIVFLLAASAFVSASEVAFFSLSPADFSKIEEQKHRSDKIILELLKKSEYLLATILVANNFVNVCVIILSTVLFNTVFDFSQALVLGFLLETILLTFLLLLFGEIMPKVFAQKQPLSVARITASSLNVVGKVIYPLASLLVKSTNVVNRFVGKKKMDISVDELSKALELTSDEIVEEKDMLEGIIKFYNRTAVEIMTSRLDMADIDIKAGFKEVLAYILEVGYSRIPVYSGTRDQIKGILYIKDLLPFIDKGDKFRWQSLLRPAYFVPEKKKIDDLLEEFRTNKIHLAIVVDEFGGTSGIVTLEDVLEEIVGEISDEYDEDERLFVKLNDGAYIFEGKILLPDFFKILDIDETEFGKITSDVDTLAGLILEIKGDFPKKQEIIPYKQYRFQILEQDKQRISKVKFFIEQLPDTDSK